MLPLHDYAGNTPAALRTRAVVSVAHRQQELGRTDGQMDSQLLPKPGKASNTDAGHCFSLGQGMGKRIALSSALDYVG